MTGGMSIALMILGAVLVVVLWRAARIWFPLFAEVLRGGRPRIWISGPSPTLLVRGKQHCPECGAKIETSPPVEGEEAFHCASCGCKAHWR